MACALGLSSGSLLRVRLEKHPQQPLGLGWNPNWSLRPGLCPLCIGCRAQAQSTEVSANDGTKKNSTWTHADPFASAEPYAGWEALDAKPEGDYWAGLLQIGAGVALAVGFALVSHAAYARRGVPKDVVASPAAVQDILSGQETEFESQSLSGTVTLEKDEGNLASPQAEEINADANGVAKIEDTEQAQQTQIEGAAVHVEDKKIQQKAAPGQVSNPHEELADLSAEGAVVSAAPLVRDRDLAPGQDSHLTSLVLVEDANPTDSIFGVDPDEVEPTMPRSKEHSELLQKNPVSGQFSVSDTDPLSAEELQPIVANEVDQFVVTSSERPESASDALPAELEKSTDVNEEDAVVALPAAGSAFADERSGLSSSSEMQQFTVEPDINAPSAAEAELRSNSQIENPMANSTTDSGEDLGSAQQLSAEAVLEFVPEIDLQQYPVAATSKRTDDQALATLSLPVLPDVAQSVSLLVVTPEGEEIGKALRIVQPSPSADVTAAEPVEDISVSGVVDAAEPDDPVIMNYPTHHSDSLKFGSFGIPAPSTPSAAAQVSPGRVLIPAVVDQVQEQALAVLQALKVVETGIEAGDVCTRREYARWLINASNVLARSSSRKIFPAMYIESFTDLAFDDVSPEDPDFPFIQGLAEAGLISSRLTLQDSRSADSEPVLFAPDAPLSRQDLISWKLAMEGGTRTVDRKTLQEKSGFIDIDRIHEDAWPAIFADLSAGEDSIIATAFGYTRRFHPSKPTTIAQAAVALVLGESSAVVADESARLQAEKIAEQAVQEQLELEARALQEVDSALKEMLDLEKEGRLQAEAAAEALKSELDKIKSAREQESLALLKEHAAVDSDKQVLAEYKRQLEEELSTLATLRAELALEREREGVARVGVEQERKDVWKAKSELEVEKQALALARQWAEQEAKNARAHSKVLEEVRRRWENQGIEVSVDGKIAEDNIPEQTWTYADTDADTASQTAPAAADSGIAEQADVTASADVVQRIKARAVNFAQNGARNVLELVRKVVQALRNTLAELRAQAANKVSSVAAATESAMRNSVAYMQKKAEETRELAVSGSAGASATLAKTTRKVADAVKDEAAKIMQKFKTT